MNLRRTLGAIASVQGGNVTPAELVRQHLGLLAAELEVLEETKRLMRGAHARSQKAFRAAIILVATPEQKTEILVLAERIEQVQRELM